MNEMTRTSTTTSEHEETPSADLGQLLAASVTNDGARNPNVISGVVIGELADFSASGEPLVQFPENPSSEPTTARTTIKLSSSDIGCQVVLMFERGDANHPIVVGRLENATSVQPPLPGPWEADVDEERVVLSAKREIELRCGKASIILTKAGKILLRGAYVLSRSSGTNRIKGASVQIN